jgi:RNA polymerase sigma factor FliA
VTDQDVAFVERMARWYVKQHVRHRDTVSRLDTRDLVQDGAVAFLEVERRYDPTRGAQLQTFANRRVFGSFVDAARKCTTWSRSRREEREVTTADEAMPEQVLEASQPASVIGAEFAARVRRALARLPARERRVMTLYYYGDATMKQIGTELGVRESRVSQLHTRAIQRLRVALGG